MRRARRRLLAWSGAAALAAGLGMAAGASDLLVQSTVAVPTDRLQFSSDFQPVHLTSAWAWADVNVAEHSGHLHEHTLTTVDPPSRIQETLTHHTAATTLCVYNGGPDVTCRAPGNVSSASTSGHADVLDWKPSGSVHNSATNLKEERPHVRVEGYLEIETGATCKFDSTGAITVAGLQPTGTIRASSTSDALSTQLFDVSGVANGATSIQQHTFRSTVAGADATSTVDMQITPSWGNDADDRTAYSEVRIRYRASSPELVAGGHTLGYEESGWVHYTVRSECGLQSNDGKGSALRVEPTTTSTAVAAALLTPETATSTPAPETTETATSPTTTTMPVTTETTASTPVTTEPVATTTATAVTP